MTESINKLLRKKYPNGRDLGVLFVDTTVKDIEYWKMNKTPKHTYSQEMLNNAYFSLPPEEKKVFDLYADIHDMLLGIYDRSQGYLQQFFNAYYRILYTLLEIERSEIFVQKALKTNNYITKENSDELKKTVKETLLLLSNYKKSERAKEIKEAYQLIKSSISDFASCMEYLFLIQNLYSLNFFEVKQLFFNEAVKYIEQINKMLDEIEMSVPKIKRFFQPIKVVSFSHRIEEGSEDSSLIFRNISTNKDISRSEVNNLVKRYKYFIQEIKKELTLRGEQWE